MKKVQVKWFLLSIISFAAKVLNYPLSYFVVLFSNDNGWLPNWLNWFQTPDNSLDGDHGWKNEHRPYKTEDNEWKRYVNRVGWLWRNSMYGFRMSVLGFTVKQGFGYNYEGNQKVSNRPLSEGSVLRLLKQDGKIYWQYYYCKAWPQWLRELTGQQRCVRFNLGYKIWQNPKVGQQIQHTMAVSLTMGYST